MASPGLIFKKMNDIMKDVGAIGKDQKNTAQGFKFRGIDQFVNALYPTLCKHGVFMTTEVLEKTEVLKDVERSSGKKGVDKHVALTMKYTFHAEDGSAVSSTIASEGLDSGDKATNKALSAALKYMLIQTLCIPTEDMEEGDRVTPELAPAANITETKSAPRGFGAPPAKTLNEVAKDKALTAAAPASQAPPKGWR